jgi:hypothetical protein
LAYESASPAFPKSLATEQQTARHKTEQGNDGQRKTAKGGKFWPFPVTGVRNAAL